MMSLHELIAGKNGVFYGRHSTDKQEMVSQRRVAGDLVTKYGGHLLALDYPDEDVSATRVPLIKRKHLQRLLEDASDHKFDFVVSYARDRLARDAYEHQVIREEMHELGIPIVFASTETVYDSGDLVIELMQDGLSQYEVEQTRVRTRDTLVTRVEKGDWVGRKPPYGYVFDKETEEILQVPDEIVIVRDIFDRYVKGEGCHRIAKHLGGTWRKEKVKAIVTNPFYAGYLTAFKGKKKAHNSVRDRNEWVMSKKPSEKIPAILSKDEWERCWNLFEQRRNREIAPRHYNTNFLFKGLVTCENCGQPFETKNQMTRSNSGKRYGDRYYICGCRRLRAKAFEDELIDKILDQVNRRLLASEGLKQVLDEVHQSFRNEVSKLEADIKGFERENAQAKKRIDDADAEMRRIYKAEEDSDEKMLNMLQRFRVGRQAECNERTQKIEVMQKRLEFLQSIDIKDVEWERVYDEVKRRDRQSLRRFLVFLIDNIAVDSAMDIQFTARVDLNK